MGRIALLIVTAFTLSIGSAEARGFHGLGHGSWHSHGIREDDTSGVAHGRRHGNDTYMKAARDERDKLLSKLKSICRGC